MAKHKRHHHSSSHAGHSSHMRHHSDGAYAGYDARRAEEHRDSMMISEDHSAIANMPQQPKIAYWPKESYEHMSPLDDTIRVIDVQMKDDSRMHKRGKYPEKY